MPYAFFSFAFLWGALVMGLAFLATGNIAKYFDPTLLTGFMVAAIVTLIVWFLLGLA